MNAMRYPIRAVAQMTGLTIDTLRAWERRYRVVIPERGPRGRLYTEKQVERLLLLREAVEHGHSIGQASGLNDAQLRQASRGRGAAAVRSKPPAASFTPTEAIRPVVDRIEHFDFAGADTELSRLAFLMSPKQLVREVVVPLMHTVGERFHSGTLTVAQEHMTSALLRNVLGTLIHLYAPRVARARLIFATLAGEMHEFGILAAALLAAGSGLGIVYLGANLPAAEILAGAKRTSADVVALGVTALHETTPRDFQQICRGLGKKVDLWIGGAGAAKLLAVNGRRAKVLKDFEQFESLLARWRAHA
jgi:DNA-binding transcriptional MerR regulator/methylmalonyl-CoA mutase cobalamin-binding subunit